MPPVAIIAIIAVITVAWLVAAVFAWALIHGAQKLHRAERQAREAAAPRPAGLTTLPRRDEVFDVEKHAA